MVLTPVPLASTAVVGRAFTVTAEVVAAQLGTVLLVKVNVEVPADTADTAPVLALTVATDEVLLTQVPPLAGVKVVEPLAHIELLPEILTVGRLVTDMDGAP